MNYLFFIIVLGVVLAVLGIATFSKFKLDNEQYDRLKWVVIRWSYLVTFIALIVKTFDVQYGIETVTIVAGIGAMLAGLLGISNKEWTGEGITNMFNDDLLKEMVGYDESVEAEEDEESEV